MIKRLVQVFTLFLAAFLTACGGGGSSSPVTIEVTPVAGKFTATGGGIVDVFNSTGTKIGSSTIGSSGKATVTLNSSAVPSIMVFRVSGGTYYDEGTDSTKSNDFMLSVVSSGTNGGNYPVTPLTHMAAAFAGVDGSASTLTLPSGANALSSTTIARANNLVPYLLGVDPTLLDITVVPTLVSDKTPTLPTAASSVKANSYAYILAILSFNAATAPTPATSNYIATLFANAKSAYSLADKTNNLAGGTFVWPSYMTETSGTNTVLKTSSMPTGAGTLGAALASANLVVTSRIAVLGDIGTAVSYIGKTQAYAATAPGSYCPNYLNSAGQQVLDPTDPKNMYIFYTATGYMSDPGFRVTSWSGTSTSFTIFNGAPSAAGESGSSGIYLQYYTVYGLPSWASGGSTGGIFTGTYSGVSGGTDGYALNTLMMANGYTGTGTFNLTYSGMNTSTPYKLSTTGSSTGGLRQVVLSCPNA